MCFNEKLLNNSNVILSSKAVSFNDGLKDDSYPTLDGKIFFFFQLVTVYFTWVILQKSAPVKNFLGANLRCDARAWEQSTGPA